MKVRKYLADCIPAECDAAGVNCLQIDLSCVLFRLVFTCYLIRLQSTIYCSETEMEQNKKIFRSQHFTVVLLESYRFDNFILSKKKKVLHCYNNATSSIFNLSCTENNFLVVILFTYRLMPFRTVQTQSQSRIAKSRK